MKSIENTNTTIKDLVCKLCNKTFKSEYIYQRHIKQKIKCNINKEYKIVEREIIKCKLCNKIFRTEYLLNKHMNSKIKCIQENIKKNNQILDIKQIKKKIYNIQFKITKKNNESINSIKNICIFCNQAYTRKQSLIRHLDNNCSIKKNMLEQINIYKLEVNKYNKMKDKIITEINKGNKIINNTSITNNNSNNTNNITNNITNNLTVQIQINPFGKEDLSHITLEDYKKCLEQRFPGLFEYIRLVHLNKNAPQNHNILLTNGKSKFLKVYKEGKFKTEYKDEIIGDILNNNMWRLEEKAQELEGKVNNKIINNHKEFKQVYYKNDKNLIKRNMETVENMFLDDKNIIEGTHNNMLS